MDKQNVEDENDDDIEEGEDDNEEEDDNDEEDDTIDPECQTWVNGSLLLHWPTGRLHSYERRC